VIVLLVVVDVMDAMSVWDGSEVSLPDDVVFHSLPIAVPFSDIAFVGEHISSPTMI
jgi:hypothetical protein